MKSSSPSAESTHRLAKLLVDAGEVSTFDEAAAKLQSLRLMVSVSRDVISSFNHQAALLTAVNVASRAFIGGIFVRGDLDVKCLVPGFQEMSLREAVVNNGGTIRRRVAPRLPLVVL